jgi:hypothetical protein
MVHVQFWSRNFSCRLLPQVPFYYCSVIPASHILSCSVVIQALQSEFAKLRALEHCEAVLTLLLVYHYTIWVMCPLISVEVLK